MREPVYLTDAEVFKELRGIALGKIYLDFDESKISSLSEMKEIVNNFKTRQPRGTILSGSFGCGKTTLLHWLAFRILKDVPADCLRSIHLPIIPGGEDEIYIVSKRPCFSIKMCRTSKLLTLMLERQHEAVQTFERAEILMLDDFARIYSGDLPLTKLEDFIEYRYANLLPTFITLDITLTDMVKQTQWTAMVDRFKDSKWMFPGLVLAGGSRRK